MSQNVSSSNYFVKMYFERDSIEFHQQNRKKSVIIVAKVRLFGAIFNHYVPPYTTKALPKMS